MNLKRTKGQPTVGKKFTVEDVLEKIKEGKIKLPEPEGEIEFTKISFNVPKKLLAEFDQIAYLNHYSRVEAFKESMRQFIVDATPENYASSEDWEGMWKGMFDGILKVSEDPKYKKLGIDPAALASSQAAQMHPTSGWTTFEEADSQTIQKNRKRFADDDFTL